MVKTEVERTNFQQLLAQDRNLVKDALTGLFVCVAARRSLLKRKQAAILLRESKQPASLCRLRINLTTSITDEALRNAPLRI